jgi:hypothetical protein
MQLADEWIDKLHGGKITWAGGRQRARRPGVKQISAFYARSHCGRIFGNMVESRTRQIGDITVVELIGRLHLGNSLGFAENALNRLIDGGLRKLVLDLAGLDYIDSAGLGMVIFCSGRME